MKWNFLALYRPNKIKLFKENIFLIVWNSSFYIHWIDTIFAWIDVKIFKEQSFFVLMFFFKLKFKFLASRSFIKNRKLLWSTHTFQRLIQSFIRDKHFKHNKRTSLFEYIWSISRPELGNWGHLFRNIKTEYVFTT